MMVCPGGQKSLSFFTLRTKQLFVTTDDNERSS
jgi:hypothetical protein